MFKDNNSGEFIVTARKWRPLKFKDVVGQEHITTTLKNALSGNRIHHAYLFSGPRGVGKTTTARVLARAINCLNIEDSEPCNECDNCRAVLEGKSLDIIEIDGASNNSVDDVRNLKENAKYPPAIGKIKMYIIDEVHMLSTSAFNALLKILEEPPTHLMFVFATTEPHKVPATILSRCQRHAFRRMEIDLIFNHLKYISSREGINIDDESIFTIARKADGSMRDSQSIFDQVIAFCGNDIKYSEMAVALHLIDQDFYFTISDAIIEKDFNRILGISDEVSKKGYDIHECISGILEFFRNLLTVKVIGDTNLIDTSVQFADKFKTTAQNFEKEDLLRMLNLIAMTEQSIKFAPQPKIRFEILLFQLASMEKALNLSDLISEIKKHTLNSDSSEFQKKNEVVKKTPIIETIPEITSGLADKYVETLPKKSFVKENNDIYTNLNNTNPTDSSAKSLKSKWSDFVSKYSNAESGLHFLGSGLIDDINFMKGEIILNISSDFAFQSLSQKKSLIADALREFYGSSIGIKLNKIHTKDDKNVGIELESNKNKQTNDISSMSTVLTDDLTNKSPVENLIIKYFKAKEY